VKPRDFAESMLAQEYFWFVIEFRTQDIDLAFVHQTNRSRASLVGRGREFLCITVRGQSDNFHSIRNVVRHFQRAIANRASRAQDYNTLAVHKKTGFTGLRRISENLNP